MQSDCNQQNQIGLRQDCQVIEGLHQKPGISTNCNQPSPIAPRIHPSSRNACTIFCNSVQFRGLGQNCRFNAIPPQSCVDPPDRTQDCDRTPSGKPLAIHPVQSNPCRSRHDQTRLQLDCETTKDCNVIGRIALKLYGLQVNCSNYTSHSGIEASNPSNLLQSSCNPKSPYNPLQSRQNNWRKDIRN